MKLFNRFDKNTRKRTPLTLAIAAIAGSALAFAPATTTAQDWDDDYDADDAYEWEADEGYHEEEWYDPSDWFDDSVDAGYSVDYEYDVYDYGGYWDGYYDGYYDDEYGIDYYDDEWDADYSSVYTDGYYDGYYDARQDYEYDPYYYVYTYEVNPGQTDQRRMQDDTRKRGDRAGNRDRNNMTRGETREARNDLNKAAQKARHDYRIRGTVEKVEHLRSQQNETRQQREMKKGVVRVTFEDGDQVIANLGPHARSEKMPVQKGNRVTLMGERTKMNGRKVLKVAQISHDGEMYKLRGKERDTDRKRQRDADDTAMNR
jgi:hypothetical protein